MISILFVVFWINVIQDIKNSFWIFIVSFAKYKEMFRLHYTFRLHKMSSLVLGINYIYNNYAELSTGNISLQYMNAGYRCQFVFYVPMTDTSHVDVLAVSNRRYYDYILLTATSISCSRSYDTWESCSHIWITSLTDTLIMIDYIKKKRGNNSNIK